jgi:hypothetical protein
VGLFENQLCIISSTSRPIGLGGDSRSSVFHRTQNQVVVLYFAGPTSGSYGIASRIRDVLDELEIVLI